MPLTRPLTQPLTGPLVRGVGEGGVVFAPYAVTGAYTAVLGDSIDAGASAGNSWFEETCRLSKQRMRSYANKGVGGNTTTQMLARIETDIVALSPKPHVCVIGGPTNDHGAGTDPAVTRQNYVDMVAALVAAGIRPAFRNCPSNNNAGTGAYNTIALRRQAILDHNAWLAAYCASNGFGLMDIFTPTYDGTGLNTDYTTDGTHFIAAGCYAAASYAAARLPAYFKTAAKPYLATAVADPLNIVANGIFVGDANADGIADNWISTSVTLPALVANTYDGVGNWQNYTTANGTLGYVSPSPSPSVAPGSIYELATLLRADAGKVVKLRVQVRDSLSNNLATYDVDWNPQATGEPQTAFIRFVAPTSSHHLSVTAQGAATGATGQMSVARFTIRDRTANP